MGNTASKAQIATLERSKELDRVDFRKDFWDCFKGPGHQLTGMSIVTFLVTITDTETVFQSLSCFLRGELKFKQYICREGHVVLELCGDA